MVSTALVTSLMSLFELIKISTAACIGHLFNNIKRAEEGASGAVSQYRRIGDIEKGIHLVTISILVSVRYFWRVDVLSKS